MGKLQWVLAYERRQVLFKLRKEYRTFHILSAGGAEIVYRTVINTVLSEGILYRWSALFVLVHYKEVCVGQALDQAPIVRIARYDDERSHSVPIEVSDHACGHSNVYKRLSVGNSVDLNMLNRYLREFRQPVPACCGVRIIIERDFFDPGKFFLI